MEEFKFVLKCLLFSCLIVVFSQTQIEGETIENKTFAYLQHSSTAHWVRAAAEGGVKLIRQGVENTQDFIEDKFGGSSSSSKVTAPNTGFFRKLEKKKTQQNTSAESEINVEDNNSEEQF